MSKKHHKKNKHPKHQHEAAKEQQHAHEKKSAPPSAGMQIMGWIGMVLLLIFLAVNIALSQMIHPLYQGVVDGNKTALVTFFKIAKNLPAFQPLKPEMENSYKSLAKEIDGENITRQEKIKKIEALLVQYHNSRDLLYAASILYTDIGNKEKGAEYQERARMIDPSL